MSRLADGFKKPYRRELENYMQEFRKDSTNLYHRFVIRMFILFERALHFIEAEGRDKEFMEFVMKLEETEKE